MQKEPCSQMYTVDFIGDGDETETVWVTHISDNVYRLDNTPLLGEEQFYIDDLVEMEPQSDGRLVCKRVVQPSGFRHAFYCLPRHLIQSRAFRNYLKQLEADGCKWENFMGGFLIISLPPDSTHDTEQEIALLAEELERRIWYRLRRLWYQTWRFLRKPK
jgi:hypothetical protein